MKTCQHCAHFLPAENRHSKIVDPGRVFKLPARCQAFQQFQLPIPTQPDTAAEDCPRFRPAVAVKLTGGLP